MFLLSLRQLPLCEQCWVVQLQRFLWICSALTTIIRVSLCYRYFKFTAITKLTQSRNRGCCPTLFCALTHWIPRHRAVTQIYEYHRVWSYLVLSLCAVEWPWFSTCRSNHRPVDFLQKTETMMSHVHDRTKFLRTKYRIIRRRNHFKRLGVILVVLTN